MKSILIISLLFMLGITLGCQKQDDTIYRVYVSLNGQPKVNAKVRIYGVNSVNPPAIDLTEYTDANGLAEFCFIHCFESSSYRPAAATQAPSKSREFDASTPPEVGLLEPLSASTIASWLSHAWYDESHQAITRGIG